MRAPLTGTSGIFLYPGYQDLTATLAEARRDGVRQVVLLSGSSAASGDMSNAITRYMSESESSGPGIGAGLDDRAVVRLHVQHAAVDTRS